MEAVMPKCLYVWQHKTEKIKEYKNSSGKTVSVAVKKTAVVRHPNGWMQV